MSLDGAQMALYRDLVEEPNLPTLLRALSISVGCGAAVTAALADELDVGGELSEVERAEFSAATHLLMRLADRYTWGADVRHGEVPQAAREFAAAVEQADAGKAQE